jgi:hypothetical protein
MNLDAFYKNLCEQVRSEGIVIFEIKNWTEEKKAFCKGDLVRKKNKNH